ncbi:MAG: NAD(P)-dependent oxidoreductase [Chloroflexi bacterium]|nr:NAD(P)-dependent oxidoreductase [Chloroflexota bacterium]
MRVGLIGTGNMGNRFGPKLLQAGHKLLVHDIDRAAAEPLVRAGAEWSGSSAELARSVDVTLTSLPSPAIVEQVVFAPEAGILAGLKSAAVYADASTSTPALAQRIAAACAERGSYGLDAPLSSGGAFTTVGGDRAGFDKALPVFEAIVDRAFYVGPAGMGQAAKLVRQYASFCAFMAEAEAMIIARKAGLDLHALNEFFQASLGGSLRDRAVESLLADERDFSTSPGSNAKLDIVAKDVSLSVELARQVGAPAGLGLATADLLERGQLQGWGRLNFWAAVQVLEQMAGTALNDTTATMPPTSQD